MIKYFEIPLIPSRHQKLKASLAGTVYTLVVRWNSISACWILDIYDSSGAVPILRGTPLVTGTDLLGQYKYLQLGGHMIVLTVAAGHPVDEIPTFTDLGIDGHLYFITATTPA